MVTHKFLSKQKGAPSTYCPFIWASWAYCIRVASRNKQISWSWKLNKKLLLSSHGPCVTIWLRKAFNGNHWACRHHASIPCYVLWLDYKKLVNTTILVSHTCFYPIEGSQPGESQPQSHISLVRTNVSKYALLGSTHMSCSSCCKNKPISHFSWHCWTSKASLCSHSCHGPDWRSLFYNLRSCLIFPRSTCSRVFFFKNSCLCRLITRITPLEQSQRWNYWPVF